MKGRKTTKKAPINKVNVIRICDTKGENGGLMLELLREGYKEGTIVRDFRYQPSNNAFYFGRNHNCVAYLGETCEIIE